jgi:hypothetical protein
MSKSFFFFIKISFLKIVNNDSFGNGAANLVVVGDTCLTIIAKP